MTNDLSPQVILYVGAIDEQFSRLRDRLQDWDGSIVYARDCQQATGLLRYGNFTLVAINIKEFRPSNVSCLTNFIRSCQVLKLDVIRLQGFSLSVIMNPAIPSSNNIFASEPKFSDIDGEKQYVARIS